MQFLPSLPSWVPNFTMTLPGPLCWRVKRKETEAEVPGVRRPSSGGRGKQYEEEEKENLKSITRHLDGRGGWGRMDTCIRMAESLRYLPETITTLLIAYTPIQNKN